MKRLTPKELEDRHIEKIIKRVYTIEKDYGIADTRKACYRYSSRRGNELALRKKISEAEEELEEMKEKVN